MDRLCLFEMSSENIPEIFILEKTSRLKKKSIVN